MGEASERLGRARGAIPRADLENGLADKAGGQGRQASESQGKSTRGPFCVRCFRGMDDGLREGTGPV
jgi:hypothetical protein